MKKNDEKKIQMIYKSNVFIIKVMIYDEFSSCFLLMLFWSSSYVNLNYEIISGLSYSQTGTISTESTKNSWASLEFIIR